mgnify:CR=1 FL=1
MEKFVVAIEEKYFRHYEVEAEDEDAAFHKVCAGEVDEIPEASPHEVKLISVEEYEEPPPPEVIKQWNEMFLESSKKHPENVLRKGYDADPPELEDYFLFDK